MISMYKKYQNPQNASFYKRSHKANRYQLLVNPPTYIDIFNQIDNAKMTTEERCFYALSILLGTRVTETLSIEQRNIKIYDKQGRELDPKTTENYLLVVRTDMLRMTINCKNNKSKKNPNKSIDIKRTELFGRAFDWILDRLQQQKYNPEKKLISFCRVTAWFRTKALFGDDSFNHIFRHYKASNDTRYGKHMEIIKREMGWTNLQPAEKYIHLNINDIQRENDRVYGPAMEAYHEAIGTKEVPASIRNKPLGPDAILGAYAAACEDKEIEQPRAFKGSGGKVGNHPLNTKYSVFKQDGVVQVINLPQHARQIRDKIRALEKKAEPIQEDILQVV